MKKISVFILVCTLCFCSLFTGCVDIWQGVEGDERVYELTEVISLYPFRYIKVKRDNTVELYIDYVATWLEVSNLGKEYAAYNAQYKHGSKTYGTYKQVGNNLEIVFDDKEYEFFTVQGDDTEAFKTAYIKNNPYDKEIFDKGKAAYDNEGSAKLVLSVSNSDNKCRPLKLKKNGNDTHISWSYYASGAIKSWTRTHTVNLGSEITNGSEITYKEKEVCKYNTDGSYNYYLYTDGVISQYAEYGSNHGVTKQCGYDENGKLATTTVYERDAEDHLCTKEYDSEGRLTTEHYRGEYNGEECSITKEYDSNGMLTREEYDSNDVDGDIIKKTYDSEGRLITEEICKMPFGELVRKKTYEYDSNGKLIAEKEYNSDNELVKEKRYDD